MSETFFLITLILSGGVIAFVGDRLGTKIGKKRISLFGLRPRYSSMIITVLTGILITATSIGFMTVISQDVRIALFGIDNLKESLTQTINKLEKSRNELLRLNEEYIQTNESLKTAKNKISLLKEEQGNLQKESAHLKQLNEELKITNQKLLDSKTAIELDNKKLYTSNSELKDTAEKLRKNLISVREGNIILKAGELLAIGVVKADLTSEEINEEIRALAESVTKNLNRRFGDSDDNCIWMYQPEVYEVIDKIEKSNTDMILRITAAGNLIEGEPILTKLEAWPNQVVFHKNEIIFSKIYSRSDSENSIYIVQDFFSEINYVASFKGILSRPFYGSIATTSVIQLYEIIDEINKTQGSFELIAYALNDTAIGDYLDVRIEISRKENF